MASQHVFHRALWLIVWVATLSGWRAGAASVIIYVDADATNGGNGTSWTAAYRYLQDALTEAAQIASSLNSVQIWVAEGTYKPDQSNAAPSGTGDRSASFHLANHVQLLGGFMGTETSESQRQPLNTFTVLSGDLEGNDTGTIPDVGRGENSLHVVRADNTDRSAVISGFLIRSGHADILEQIFRGGGLLAETPGIATTIEDCIFWSNYAASQGGAIHVHESNSVLLRRCKFVANESFIGAGVSIGEATFPQPPSSVATIANCSFVRNKANLYGAAIRIRGANTLIVNCTFSENITISSEGGKALEADNSSAAVMKHCLIYETRSHSAVSVYEGALVTIERSLLFGGINQANGQITTISLLPAVDPTFANIYGLDGVLGTPDDSVEVLADSVVIDAGDNALLATLRCTASRDLLRAKRVYDGDGSGPAIVDVGAIEYGAGPQAEGGTRVYTSGDSPPGGSGYDWSGAIADLRDALDMAANSVPDCGAMEVWVAAAREPYRPDSPLSQGGNRASSFQLADGVAVYGGFDGTETSLDQRNPAANPTILSGDLNGDDVPGNPALNRDDNSYNVVRGENLSSVTILDGFTITSGNADNFANIHQRVGAGVYVIDSSPVIRNCIFREHFGRSGALYAWGDSQMLVEHCAFLLNEAWYGGAAGFTGQEHRFLGCIFESNHAIDLGGALYPEQGSSSAFIDCEFRGNIADSSGSGMYAPNNCDVTILNCRFYNNHASGGGSVVATNLVTARIANSVFVGNTCSEGPGSIGGFSAYGGVTDIVNCAFVANRSGPDLGAIHLHIACSEGGQLNVRNTIAWENTADGQVIEAGQISYGSPGCSPEPLNHISVQYSTVSGWSGFYGGLGNNDTDPMFLVLPSPGNDGDLRLRPRSLAIDSGDSSAVPADGLDLDGDGNDTEKIPFDLAGNPRLIDAPVPDNGPGAPPHVDRGPYEINFNCPDCPGDRIWIRPQGGDFGVAANWVLGVPPPDRSARFGLVNADYAVTFDGPRTNNQCIVEAGHVTFDLDGAQYELADVTPGLDGLLVIGDQRPTPAVLSLPNGRIKSTDVSIGNGLDSEGSVVLTGAGTELKATRFTTVGESGDGRLTIEGGALSTAQAGFVGLGSQSLGDVFITGVNSRWSLQSVLQIINGSVNVNTNATLKTNFGTFIYENGALVGDGTVIGPVYNNSGQVAPGSSAGTLSIDGSYVQVQSDAKFGNSSGRLLCEIGGSAPGEHDVLAVTATASLGGLLDVSLINGYDPQPTDPAVQVLTAAQLVGTFDVAFFPGFPPPDPKDPDKGQRLMRLSYGPGAANGSGGPEGAGVSVFVDILGDPINLQGAPEQSVTGLPFDAVVADFDGYMDVNGETTLDLAVSLPDPNNPDTAPGSVFILLNAGNDSNDDWLGFSLGTVSATVGIDPRGLAVADFNADGDLDIGVANFGSDTVGILLNDGNATPSFAHTPFGVGDAPVAVAAGDLNNSTGPDLVVVNSGSDTISVLHNNGSAVFAVSETLIAGDEPSDVALAKMEGSPSSDPDLDILITNKGDDNVMVFYNDLFASAFPTPPIVIPVGPSPDPILPGDLDNDKDLDIIELDTGDVQGTVSIILNNGDGTFAPSVQLPVGENPFSLALVDLDNDGDLEIATVATNEQSDRVIRILRNDQVGGQLAFAAFPDQGAGSAPILIAGQGLDLDNDGGIDLDVNNDGRDDLVSITENSLLLAMGGDGGADGVPAAQSRHEAGTSLDSADHQQPRVTRPNLASALLNLPPTPPCPGDANGDNAVDSTDLNIILSDLGCTIPPQTDCPGDLDADGDTDSTDLNIVLTAFGEPCR